MQDDKTEIAELKAREDKVDELRSWKEKIDEIIDKLEGKMSV